MCCIISGGSTKRDEGSSNVRFLFKGLRAENV
jgi:hypothetical protein